VKFNVPIISTVCPQEGPGLGIFLTQLPHESSGLD